MKRLVYLVGILIIAAACKEVYEKPPQAFIEATLFNSSTKLAMSSVVTIRGVGIDSLWLYQSNVNQFLLPLSTKDTTNFLVTFDSKTDTLSIVHETTQKYASMETGFYYEYKMRAIQYTHNRIDSLEITDSLVTIIWNENIKFYLHPLPAGGN